MVVMIKSFRSILGAFHSQRNDSLAHTTAIHSSTKTLTLRTPTPSALGALKLGHFLGPFWAFGLGLTQAFNAVLS
jgi:hypothetical protein